MKIRRGASLVAILQPAGRSGRSFLLSSLILLGLLLAGCTEKARTLHVGVSQFEVQSMLAIDAIDRLRLAEVAPAARSPAQATDELVRNVLDFEGEITVDALPVLIDPYALDAAAMAESDRRWAAFIGDMRTQYTAFARIFDSIERASFTGREAIRQTKPYVEKLTAQMAFFADSIARNPPQLLQQRSAMLQGLNDIKAGSAPTDEKARQIARWRDDWLALEAAEGELMRQTVEQCVKAAIIGREIRQQIEIYDDVTLDDIVEAMNRGFQIAQSVTGDDYAQLRGRADEIVQTIRADPVWSSVADTVLREINAARGAA